MIPMQIFGLIISLGAAVICGKTETMRLKKAGVDLAALSAEVEAEKDEDKDGPPSSKIVLGRPDPDDSCDRSISKEWRSAISDLHVWYHDRSDDQLSGYGTSGKNF